MGFLFGLKKESFVEGGEKMKAMAKKWFYEEVTNAYYEKGEEVPVEEEAAKKLEKEGKIYIKEDKETKKKENKTEIE